ncbi:class I SAM-dependent methyltransferase [Saccharopolyspora sp. SCSIO 74807]|uniref:class I SAM-dependent methyltransferase n=1 Tax=Saccharopolyspora sp. SCSIO 74807 TaxID=3118084 RepID=UPI0030CA8EBC
MFMLMLVPQAVDAGRTHHQPARCNFVDDLDEMLSQQQQYYRERARDYDAWINNYLLPAEKKFEELVNSSPLTGDILEMACGSGYWTERISRVAHHVTALDGSQEMLDIVDGRQLPNVSTAQADLFNWNPPTQWDGIFFANWLAHVPDARFEQFWRTVSAALLPTGTVVIMDVAPAEKFIEEEVVDDSSLPIARRRLKDGRRFDIVKKYWEPEELLDRISPLGFTGKATPVGQEAGRGFVWYELEKRNEF